MQTNWSIAVKIFGAFEVLVVLLILTGDHIGGALYINGELEESGVASAVMGNPINSVAWLARKLDEFGVHMEAGHTILSGSFIRAHPMVIGDTFVADYGPLGQISFGVNTIKAARFFLVFSKR